MNRVGVLLNACPREKTLIRHGLIKWKCSCFDNDYSPKQQITLMQLFLSLFITAAVVFCLETGDSASRLLFWKRPFKTGCLGNMIQMSDSAGSLCLIDTLPGRTLRALSGIHEVIT